MSSQVVWLAAPSLYKSTPSNTGGHGAFPSDAPWQVFQRSATNTPALLAIGPVVGLFRRTCNKANPVLSLYIAAVPLSNCPASSCVA